MEYLTPNYWNGLARVGVSLQPLYLLYFFLPNVTMNGLGMESDS